MSKEYMLLPDCSLSATSTRSDEKREKSFLKTKYMKVILKNTVR